jgi:hypothetical protein
VGPGGRAGRPVSAEQDRHLPDEPVGWDNDGTDRVFGQDAA